MSLRALRKIKERQGKTEKIPAVPQEEEEDEEEPSPKGGFAQFGYIFVVFQVQTVMLLEKKSQKKRRRRLRLNLLLRKNWRSQLLPQKRKRKKSLWLKRRRKSITEALTTPNRKKKGKKSHQEKRKPSEPLEEEKEIRIAPAAPLEEKKVTKSSLKMEARFLNPEREFNKLFKEFGLAEGGEEEKLTATEEATAGVHLSKKAKQRLERYKQAMEKEKKRGAGKTLLAHSDITKSVIPRIISMRLCEPDESGHTVFTYETTEDFNIIQKRFVEAQRSNNISQLYEFLSTHYYHPECLLAISEFSRLKGSFVESTKLLERCLTVFEATWNYSFAPLKDPPNTRLDLKNSRLCQLFGEALFRYIDVLGRRGCSRTALEYCKLVLSFWPEGDPYGVLLLLDYYALRAREYQFFQDFVSGWFVKEFYKQVGEKFQSLFLMPNILYSCALSKKMENMGSVVKEAQLTEDYAKVLSVKNIDEIVKLGENSILIVGIILYPGLLKHIINKIKNPTGTAWDETLKELKILAKGPKKYYASYSWLCKDKNLECAKATLKKIYAIYEEKAATCFTSEAIQSWLKSVTSFLADGFLKGDFDPKLIREQIVSEATCPFYLDRYSHLNVLDYKDDLTTIPPEQLNPMIENTLFAPQMQQPPEEPGAPPNPLTLFFRSLFHQKEEEQIVNNSTNVKLMYHMFFAFD
eukprot:TRINITY_DN578_c0_g1_i1.p3 TRINITY_DN578_c0_g1~~TRINITY_DN578_c0_g1_i1.p3  ORF type:complete len:691 (-),score=111.23 TRINITY_DN578_c0_g1_i1:44-2116(-)